MLGGNQFVKVDFPFVESKLFRELSGAAVKVYLIMRRYIIRDPKNRLYRGGKLGCSLYKDTIEQKSGLSHTTVTKVYQELLDKGIIRHQRTGRASVFVLGELEEVETEQGRSIVEVFYLDQIIDQQTGLSSDVQKMDIRNQPSGISESNNPDLRNPPIGHPKVNREHLYTEDSTTSPVGVSRHRQKPPPAPPLAETLTDLGVTKRIANNVLQHADLAQASPFIEYSLHRLSQGWRPRESLPAYLVAGIKEGWVVPKWFKTQAELEEEKAETTRWREREGKLLEEQRQREEAEAARQRKESLELLGIDENTAALWDEVNSWLKEHGLWRPCLTTAELGKVTAKKATLLVGYEFALDLVKRCAEDIANALRELTGKVVEVEVKLDERLGG